MSVSIASAPSMIGSLSPGSQIQIVRPIAVSSDTAVRPGTRLRRTNCERNRPTIITTMQPPTSASSGDSSL